MSTVELTAAHLDEVDSLSAIISSLRLETQQAAEEVQFLREWRHQHEIDLDKAHDTISDLRQAAQHAAESQRALHEVALDQSSSLRWAFWKASRSLCLLQVVSSSHIGVPHCAHTAYLEDKDTCLFRRVKCCLRVHQNHAFMRRHSWLCREDLRSLHAFAESELARMTDDLATSLHHVASTAADAGEAHALSSENQIESRGAQHSVDGAPAEAACSLSALENLQEQLTLLRAECTEAQQLKDHWHSEYTAQVRPRCYLTSALNVMHGCMSRLSALPGVPRCLSLSAAQGRLLTII